MADARFLHSRVLAASTTTVVEIGTAVGVSAAVICGALRERAPNYSVVTYDNSTIYAPDGRRIGEAAEEMLPPDDFARIRFRNPTTSLDVRTDFAPDSIEFAFVDANHMHPWPALDLLALLPCLRPGAEVAFHDINLPLHHPEYDHWGAKHLFDGLETIKHVDPETNPPNIGSIIVPSDRDSFAGQIRVIVHAHRWEHQPSTEHLALAEPT
jgi:predicted O-methyltransferase YrrM